MELKISLEEAIELAKKLGNWRNCGHCNLMGLRITEYSAYYHTSDNDMFKFEVRKEKFLFMKPKYYLDIIYRNNSLAKYRAPKLEEIYKLAELNNLEGIAKDEERKLKGLRELLGK